MIAIVLSVLFFAAVVWRGMRPIVEARTKCVNFLDTNRTYHIDSDWNGSYSELIQTLTVARSYPIDESECVDAIVDNERHRFAMRNDADVAALLAKNPRVVTFVVTPKRVESKYRPGRNPTLADDLVRSSGCGVSDQ
jgi:hypothetical protein